MIKRVLGKFKNAFQGLGIAISTDNSFKTHIVFLVISVILGFLFSLPLGEWALLIFAIGLVFVSELFNTAIEYLVRMFTQEYHELAEKLLDISAGAVLFATFVAITVGGIIFLPKLMEMSTHLI